MPELWVIVILLVLASFGILAYGYWLADDPNVLQPPPRKHRKHTWEDHHVDEQ